MNELNELEKAVLQWVAEHSDDSALIAQIATASLTKREWTKVGFHIDLSVDSSCPAVEFSFPINGPEIESVDIEHGATSLIWGKNGYVNAIELVAYGEYFAESVTQFSFRK